MFLKIAATPHLRPGNIVSLVPSLTELLFSLGLNEEVTGITKFCIHPAHWQQSKIIIGGTKNLHVQQIISLKPDLVIANKEENVKEQVEELAEYSPVWLTDIHTVEDALGMITDIGRITCKPEEAHTIRQNIAENFQGFTTLRHQPLKACYLIWKDPLMTAGNDNFINDMLFKAGFDNVFGHLKRYPEISPEDIERSGAAVILLASEPYPFGEKHLHIFRELFPGKKILLVDGELFSWYGSRMLDAPAYFKQLHQQAKSLCT